MKTRFLPGFFSSFREGNYKQHLDKKRSAFLCMLEPLVSSASLPEVFTSFVGKGFRTRAKYKIFQREGRLFVEGTDPLKGTVPYEEALWILPPRGRKMVPQIVAVLETEKRAFPVDGLEMRLSHGHRDVLVVLSVKKDIKKSFEPLVRLLLESVKGLVGVVIPSQHKVIGERALSHRILGCEISAPYDTFFQSHSVLTPRLIEVVIESFSQACNRGLLDLYCGVGLFSLFSAKFFSEIMGVDNSPSAVEYARWNSKQWGLNNTYFIRSDVSGFLNKKTVESVDCLVVDPPRSGCSQGTVEKMLEIGAEYVCLVSCCPETFVRDLKIWLKNGYSVGAMSALDMFPFTDFLETVTLLRK
ncbi:MAG: class I SAM-dependent RNA methyltransferase [Candidatus Aminicenantes bacterium]|nr:class I SAM-dependent RNA methyltransferase [Candidatus Aminicenantes bacterium]